jgi:hypothetical protein
VTITRVGAADLDELIPLMREADGAHQHAAQTLYDRCNAERSEWITYTLAVTPR